MYRWLIPMIGVIVVTAGIAYSAGRGASSSPPDSTSPARATPLTEVDVESTPANLREALATALPEQLDYYLYRCIPDTEIALTQEQVDTVYQCLKPQGIVGTAVVADGPIPVAVFQLLQQDRNVYGNFFIAWREEGTWATQELRDGRYPVGERLTIYAQGNPPPGPTIREEEKDGRVFVTLVVDSLSGSSEPHMSAVLLAHEQGIWRVRWNSLAEPETRPLTHHRFVRFDGDGIDRLIIEGNVCSNPGADAPEDQIFGEVNGGPHRHYTQIWELQGDEYVMASNVVRASPYNTLTEFVYALRTGDVNSAAQYAGSNDVLDQARASDLTNAARQWIADISDEQWDRVQASGRLLESTIACSKPSMKVRIDFVSGGEAPMIASITREPDSPTCRQ